VGWAPAGARVAVAILNHHTFPLVLLIPAFYATVVRYCHDYTTPWVHVQHNMTTIRNLHISHNALKIIQGVTIQGMVLPQFKSTSNIPLMPN
jgi:hypothetical protein